MKHPMMKQLKKLGFYWGHPSLKYIDIKRLVSNIPAIVDLWLTIIVKWQPNHVICDLFFYVHNAINHGKYRGLNGSTVEIRCCADLPRLLAGTKNSPKSMCSHVIFIVFFNFLIEIAGGGGVNQFLLKIQSFWYIICLCRCSEQKGHQFLFSGIGWSVRATNSWLLRCVCNMDSYILERKCYNHLETRGVVIFKIERGKE